MGVEHKHAYRFVYLRSEEWQNVRLEAMVEADAVCGICGLRSLDNDAHHLWYPKSFWDTETKHLIILCRRCHEFVHELQKVTFEVRRSNRSHHILHVQKIAAAVKAYTNGRIVKNDLDLIVSPKAEISKAHLDRLTKCRVCRAEFREATEREFHPKVRMLMCNPCFDVITTETPNWDMSSKGKTWVAIRKIAVQKKIGKI